MSEKWSVTWMPVIGRNPIGGAPITLGRQHKPFDTQKEAVYFVMSLNDVSRSTAQLHLPSGDIAELDMIKQMYDSYKESKS